MENIDKKSSKQYKDNLIDKNFISKEIGVNKDPETLYSKLKFQVDLNKILNENSNKENCPECLKKIKFYCTSCSKCILKQTELPKITLPIDIHIVKHTKEKRNKSSAYPLIFLSKQFKLNEQEGRFLWKDVEDLKMSEKGHNYVLYPHKSARLVKDMSQEELEGIKSIKIIDCTWNQTKAMMEKIPENTNFIKQEGYETTFWRYQWHDDKCLATVEAIYYLLKEYDEACTELCKKDENLTLDNILFFYFLQYQQIKKNDRIMNYTKNKEYFEKVKKQKV